ncbi:MAG TPA: hypothetical protein G4O17_01020 [Dehalococcoidia bacterium]|nr:hypothetical protein [Dehalococcoidia bacterium]
MTKKSKPIPQPEQYEETPDWSAIEHQVRMVSHTGDDGVRLQADPEHILAEAQRLADIYRKAGKPLPDTLAALV